ncbi:MAG TPA: hypothetical protein VFK82_10525 [Burkholderiaceae bacterium]|nr:hypothetical protein [Burkholderiaceae bacterium]
MNHLETVRTHQNAAVGQRTLAERQFEDLWVALEPYGGLDGGDHLARSFGARFGTRLGDLARRIVCGDLIAIEHRGEYWLPRLQFAAASDAMNPLLVPVVAELKDVLDAADLCWWLISPNVALAGEIPVERLACDARGVVDAARVERFIVRL